METRKLRNNPEIHAHAVKKPSKRGNGTHRPCTRIHHEMTISSMENFQDISIEKAFGAKLRELRKARGLSQEAFAELAGLDRSYLGGVERGARNVSLININRISLALKMPMEELFKDL